MKPEHGRSKAATRDEAAEERTTGLWILAAALFFAGTALASIFL